MLRAIAIGAVGLLCLWPMAAAYLGTRAGAGPSNKIPLVVACLGLAAAPIAVAGAGLLKRFNLASTALDVLMLGPIIACIAFFFCYAGTDSGWLARFYLGSGIILIPIGLILAIGLLLSGPTGWH